MQPEYAFVVYTLALIAVPLGLILIAVVGDNDARIARWSERIAASRAKREADRVLGAAKRAAIYARYEDKRKVRKSSQPPKFLVKAIAWLEKKEAEAKQKRA